MLVAEDDPKQAELLRRYLEHDGHAVTVVGDGRAALEEVRGNPPDLLVLDLMMPRVDGLDVCRILRRDSEVPILVVTARAGEDDLLLGLDLGADDYLTKPYSPRELAARVRTLLRRTARRPRDADQALRVGDLVVDPVRHEVYVRGEAVACTPGEFRLLSTLAAQPDRVFTREQLLQSLHGFESYLTARTVDVHVMNLRRKIERDPRQPVRLLTVYGIGYKLSGV